MTTQIARCAKCGRSLKQPSASGYGPVCERAVLGSRTVPVQAKQTAPDPRQGDLFPNLWQRIKVRIAEVLSAWDDPFNWEGR